MKNILVLAAFALAACNPGDGAQTQGLHVENGWATPTPGGVHVSAGYVTIVHDSDRADVLTAANSTRAANVDLHAMSMNGAIMQMRSIASMEIPAHETVTLAPGGSHLMFNGVSTPFAEGERIPVQLMFQHAGTVSVELPVSRSAPAHQH